MSKRSVVPVVKPKSTVNPRSYNVPKEACTAQHENTDKDEEYARQLQQEIYNEQEQLDAELARKIDEEENKKQREMFIPMGGMSSNGRPMTATPLRQLFRHMFGVGAQAIDLDDGDDNDNVTPAVEPELCETLAASGISPTTESVGATAGRDAGGVIARGLPERSPDRTRRHRNDKSPARPARGRAHFHRRRPSENSNPTDAPDPSVDLLPGVRANPAFVRNHHRTRRIVVNPDRDGEENSENTTQEMALRRLGMGPRQGTFNVPEGEFDPDFMVLDLGENERQREDNFINIMRDPFLLMLLLIGRDPGFMVPDDVDSTDYEAMWELAERIGDVKSRGMKEDEIKKIPTRICKRVRNQDESCSICLSKFAYAEKIQTLPCKHEYHQHCLLEWLKRNAICPICRQDVKTICS